MGSSRERKRSDACTSSIIAIVRLHAKLDNLYVHLQVGSPAQLLSCADFAEIEPVNGAKQALEHLKQYFELHVVTSRQSDIEAQTRAFISQHFPSTFTDIHFGNHFGKSGERISKPAMCAKIGAVALIDDHIAYAKQCANANIPVFLFGNYAWNQSSEKLDDRITRVANWRMVAQVVTPATCQS